MSYQSMRAKQERFETCQNCKRWREHDFGFDTEGKIGRCGKFTRRYVITLAYDTCESFEAIKEVKA